MSSLDVLYGRLVTDKKLSILINAGIGLVQSLERGEFLYAEPGFFAARHYEKVKSFTVGLPISSKVLMSLTQHFGLGLEGYVNLNSIHSFYGLNLVASFRQYKFRKKKGRV